MKTALPLSTPKVKEQLLMKFIMLVERSLTAKCRGVPSCLMNVFVFQF